MMALRMPLDVGAVSRIVQDYNFQRRVPGAMLGRAMSLFMFIFMGLVPIASAITGWVLRSVTLCSCSQAAAGCW